MVRQEGSGLFKDVHLGHSPMEISGDPFEGCVRVGHVGAYQKNPFPGLEGDWNKDIPMCSHEMTTWVHEICGHGCCSNTEMG